MLLFHLFMTSAHVGCGETFSVGAGIWTRDSTNLHKFNWKLDLKLFISDSQRPNCGIKLPSWNLRSMTHWRKQSWCLKILPTREHTGKKRREGKNTISRAVVVTQLVEWSLPTSEIRSSNPVIVKLYMLTDNCCFENIKIIWNGPIKKLQFRAKIIEVKGRILIFGSLWKFL